MPDSTAMIPYADRVAISKQMSKAKSFFKMTPEEAFTKIQAGAEIGIPPFAAISGINIISGKPVMSGNLMAALIKQSGRYAYQIVTLTDKECTLEAFSVDLGKREKLGSVSFTMKDADLAQLTTGPNKHSWQKYPRNMLFYRTISNLFRWYTPDLTSGAAWYVPEELGQRVNGEGEVIDAETVPAISPEIKESTLNEWVVRVGADPAAIRAFYRVETFRELSDEDYQDALDKLQLKLKLNTSEVTNVEDERRTLQGTDQKVGDSGPGEG